MIKNKKVFMELAAFAALAIVFVLVSVFARAHKTQITNLIHIGGGIGEISFIILTALFVVFIIPLDIVLLIPIGAAVWGPIPTALMSIAGWTLGATIAFSIARNLGTPTVKRLVGLTRINAVADRIPKNDLFWTVVLLRMLVSVDVLSYALGLLSAMPLGSYVLATAIGVAPFGFYFAYAGTLPFLYQIFAISLAFILAGVVLIKYRIVREP